VTLRQKQSLFARLLAELVLWIYSQGWEVTQGEGAVDQVRKAQVNGGTQTVHDRQHMLGSLHYLRLAQDLNLFVDGHYVPDGGHPAWKAIGERWKSLDPGCAWGGDFDTVDANHVSLRHAGKA